MAVPHCTPAGGSDTPGWLDTAAYISLIMIVGGWDTVIRGVVVLGLFVIVVVAVVRVMARPCGTIA